MVLINNWTPAEHC